MPKCRNLSYQQIKVKSQSIKNVMGPNPNGPRGLEVAARAIGIYAGFETGSVVSVRNGWVRDRWISRIIGKKVSFLLRLGEGVSGDQEGM